jgi:hypothetical protein
MDDALTPTVAGPLTLQADNDRPIEPVRQILPRFIYVTMRLDEISAWIRVMAEERVSITAGLKAPKNEGRSSQKHLRQRRAYLAERLAVARKEQGDLALEKKVMEAAGHKSTDRPPLHRSRPKA